MFEQVFRLENEGNTGETGFKREVREENAKVSIVRSEKVSRVELESGVVKEERGEDSEVRGRSEESLRTLDHYHTYES